MHRPAGWTRRAKRKALPFLAFSGMLVLGACESVQTTPSDPVEVSQTAGQRLPPALQTARLQPPPRETPRSRLLIEPGSGSQQNTDSPPNSARQTPSSPPPRRTEPTTASPAAATRSVPETREPSRDQETAVPPVPPTRPRVLMPEEAETPASTEPESQPAAPSEPEAPSEPTAEPARDVGKPEEQISEATDAHAESVAEPEAQPEPDSPAPEDSETERAAAQTRAQPEAPNEEEIDIEVFEEEEERPVQEAALPPPALAEGLSLEFDSGSSDLTGAMEDRLLSLAQQLREEESQRLRLEAYAAGYDQDMSASRRLSLARALAVRAFLLDQGVRSTRMDVRAIGRSPSGQPADRVEILPAER